MELIGMKQIKAVKLTSKIFIWMIKRLLKKNSQLKEEIKHLNNRLCMSCNERIRGE